MKTVDNYINKRTYVVPNVEVVLFDNEISLTLASAPPVSGDEVNLVPGNKCVDPFKSNMA